MGAGGSGPGRVWHPGWLRQEAVVLAEFGILAGPVPSVGAECGVCISSSHFI